MSSPRAGSSEECGANSADAKRHDREEANPEIQTAMNVLGDPEFVKHRVAQQIGPLHLEHLYLDDLNLGYKGTSKNASSQPWANQIR
jgi:hypothetical protein